ncbi:MAG: DNA (cytosine-5-)-methyltransferase [Candidatus Omnitrophica bacterium]|nr:DNA (cytosine-5-)-methyltransferase [Candidatus Omnitrophota bacterium]
MKYVTTKTAARILSVSATTVRRYTMSGLLTAVRLPSSKHRRFEISEINRLLKTFIQNGQTQPKDFKNSILKPQPHPNHYLMHKYWGRKAHNILSEYIRKYTKDGDVFLDPFMGSGVGVIEAAKLGRKAIGIDINPISKFIIDNSLSKLDFDELERRYQKIRDHLKNKFATYYQTECPKCAEKSIIELTVWKECSPEKIRLKCPKHGIISKTTNKRDKNRLIAIQKEFNHLDKTRKLRYPKDLIFKYVRRSGVSYINELYTPRALIVLDSLFKEINKIRDRQIKDCFRFMFSSMLPNVSKMIPGDLDKVTYKSGWVISKFWVPKINTERSILHCFNLRYRAILKGKKELMPVKSSLAKTYVADSTRLKVNKNSVDYIFTDPPYGESIAYLTLSHFWSSWLNFKPDYSEEIIVDPYRNITKDNFSTKMYLAFKEMHRVLKPGKRLSFTFHSRDLTIWKNILEGCIKSGFVLDNIVLQHQAVSSGTQGINRNNTLRGDFIYTFIKPIHKQKIITIDYLDNAYSFIVNKIYNFLQKKQGASSALLYEYIIPEIVKKKAYLNEKGKVIQLEDLIRKNFDYIKIDNEYRWITKKNLSENNKMNVIDLFSGAGGFSEGLKQAGFNIALAIDNEPKHIDTYSYNHQSTRLIIDDINNIAADCEIDGNFSIKQYLLEKNKECDVIIGGPPCQGFSMAGLRIRKKYKFLSDKRNLLFLEYYRMVKYLKPKIFILENVPGILNFNNGSVKTEIISKFNAIGYDVSAKVLNAADYGVPQIRQRAFFIGNNIGISSKDLFPDATHKNQHVSVWDAISDLPPIHSGGGSDIMPQASSATSRTEYQSAMAEGLYDDQIYNHQSSSHSKKTLDILKMINPGETLKNLPRKYRTKSVHSGAYGRMEKNKPAYTLTTRLNTPSVGRITHPILNRTITVREAARIQSFPDNYRFFGSITTQGIQNGNSVPPMLAKRVAENIKKRCFDKHFQQTESRKI